MRSPAELYDWETVHVHGRTDQDVPFYASLGSPVLELACGTGRVTARLQAAGIDVVGLDVDAAMLAEARRHGVRRLVCADMRRFALAQRFAAVVIPYNSLQLLPDDDAMVACLRCAGEHVAPGGCVAFEVTDFQAEAAHDSVAPERLHDDGAVCLAGGLVHDRSRRLTVYHRVVCEGARRRVDHVVLRSLAPAELPALLAAAGLRAVRADVDRFRASVVAWPERPG